jgi:ABC-type cobalamin/Fe3+-siderophores transport system ATPase subunit
VHKVKTCAALTQFIIVPHFNCVQGTLLVLDEPTNHLDIPSKETLEEAIRCFEGAVIAVSHDRYFLKRIATRVLLVSGVCVCVVVAVLSHACTGNAAGVDAMCLTRWLCP